MGGGVDDAVLEHGRAARRSCGGAGRPPAEAPGPPPLRTRAGRPAAAPERCDGEASGGRGRRGRGWRAAAGAWGAVGGGGGGRVPERGLRLSDGAAARRGDEPAAGEK